MYALLLFQLCMTLVASVGLDVVLPDGTYSGFYQNNNTTISWLGISYAAPPVGNLRWRPPQPPFPFNGTRVAGFANATCPGFVRNITGANFNPPRPFNEDCLYLGVFAPSSATVSSKLPVVVNIPGGGLDSDSTTAGTIFVGASNNTMVYVTVPYRAGGFGFLASREVQAGNGLNAGYQDQRFALQWVHDNIAKFGGDPNHVTIMGDSAGGGSVVAQLTAFGGNGSNLIQAAILESPSFGILRTVEDESNDASGMQYQYDALVENTGCSNATSTLDCLRGVDFPDLYRNVSELRLSYPDDPTGGLPYFQFEPVIDGAFVPGSRYTAFAQGRFVQVPLLIGNPVNDGDLFYPGSLYGSLPNITAFHNVIYENYPNVTRDQLIGMENYYCVNGSVAGANSCNATFAYGDMRYECPNINLANYVSNTQMANPVWVYISSLNNGMHGSDGGCAVTSCGVNAMDGSSLQQYLIQFIKTFNPNSNSTYWFSGKAFHNGPWSAWNSSLPGGGERLNFIPGGYGQYNMEPLSSLMVKKCHLFSVFASGLPQ